MLIVEKKKDLKSMTSASMVKKKNLPRKSK